MTEAFADQRFNFSQKHSTYNNENWLGRVAFLWGTLSPAAIQHSSMQRAEEINLEIETLQHAYNRAELNAGGGRGGKGSWKCLKQWQ